MRENKERGAVSTGAAFLCVCLCWVMKIKERQRERRRARLKGDHSLSARERKREKGWKKGGRKSARKIASYDRVREGEHLHNVLHHSKSLRLAMLDNRGPILLIQSLYFSNTSEINNSSPFHLQPPPLVHKNHRERQAELPKFVTLTQEIDVSRPWGRPANEWIERERRKLKDGLL